jgi:hypothetical protein
MPWQFYLTSVGKEVPGCSTKLFDVDKDGNGEVRILFSALLSR